MAAMTQERMEDLEGPIMRIGTDLATRMPRPRAVSTARVERRMQELLMSDPALRAALFRFVDVRPACATPADVTRHLHELLAEADESRLARPRRRASPAASSRRRPVAAIAAHGRQADGPALHRRRGRQGRAAGTITGLWKNGVDADRRPARRGDRLRGRGRPLRRALRGALRDARAPRAAEGPGPRASTCPSRSPRSRRCCVPRRPSAGSRARDRACATCCASPATSAPTCTSTWSPSTRARRSPASRSTCCPQPEFADGPSAGIVLQAYLVDSPEYLDELLELGAGDAARAPVHDPPGQGRLLGPRGRPGRPARLDAAGLHRPPRVRPQLRDADQAPDRRHAGPIRVAIASHNLRSIAAAAAYADARRVGNDDARVPDPARARRRHAGRDRRHRPPRALLLPGRRPRRRHGLPRAPPAREHRQRLLPRRRTPAARRPPSSWRHHDHRSQRTAARAAPRGRPPRGAGRARRARRQAAARGPDADRRGRRRRAARSPPSTRRSRPASSPTPTRRPRSTSSDAIAQRRDAATRAWSRKPAADRAAALSPRRRHPAHAAASSSPRWPSARPASRGPRPTPTSARRSTSSSTTPQGALALGEGRALLQLPGERNAMRYVAARRDRRDRAVELPAGDRRRHGRRRAGDRQRRRPQARRADARRAPRPSSTRCTPAASRSTRCSLLPGGDEAGKALVADPRIHTIAFTGSCAVGLQILERAGEGRPGPAPRQARDRRDGRQERGHRRRRRRPRRGRPGAAEVGVRVRRPEVLGRLARARPRRDRRRAGRAAGRRRRRRCASARPRTSAPTSRR